MTTRADAREHALSLCYELDVRDRSATDVLADLAAPPDPYAEQLVRGVDAHRPELDALIAEAAEHWTVERMAVVDRALLRMGCYELAHQPDVPPAAVIAEAVQLAKRFSTEESGRFVNGVLAAVARRLEVLPAGEAEAG